MIKLEEKGFILILDDKGIVIDKVFNNFAGDFLSCGDSFVKFLDSESIEKYFQLRKDLNDNKAILSSELNLKIKDKINTFVVSAVKTADNRNMFIISKELDSILNYYEELMKINNQYVNNIRQIIKRRIRISENNKSNSSEIYNKMSRLNNEMVNLQRKLNKKNREIEAQKEKYQITLSSIGEGVISVNREGKVKYINPKAENLTGWSLNDAKKSMCKDVFNVEFEKKDNAVDCEFFLKNKKKDIINNIEAVLIRKNGRSFPIEFSISKIKSQNNLFGKVIVFRDISKRKITEAKLKKYASTDILTEVLNRRAGINYLEKQMEITKERREKLAVFFLDVNGLKFINDKYGHLEGDELLKLVGEILQNSLRQNDAVIRLGGDEFLVVMPNTNKKAAETIWKRIANNFCKENKNNSKDYLISVSRGTAIYGENYHLKSDQLINLADKRMYKEKEKIKNRRK